MVFAGKYSTGDQQGHGGHDNFSNTNTVQPESHVGSGGEEDNMAPDFTLETLSGDSISLSDYRGVKPVILDFWASWCHNCQRAMPVLSNLYDQYKDQIEVIGVNLQESKSTAQKFVDSRNISFPIVLDPKRTASYVYSIYYTNTHVLIDKVGNIVRVIPGDLSERDILSLIQN